MAHTVRNPLLYFAALGLVFLSGCATSPPAQAPATPALLAIPAFSAPLVDSSHAYPVGWSDFIIHSGKKRTVYELVTFQDQRVLKATSDQSASGLQAIIDIDPNAKPWINFSWWADHMLEHADMNHPDGDDSPNRIVVAFDGDKAGLDPRDRAFFEQVKFLTGRDLPYATLMYVWDPKLPVGTVSLNKHTKRIRKIVLGGATSPIKQWHKFKRNLVADYQLAYGAEAMGRIKSVGLMTDTDNTADKVVAYYGDVSVTVD